MYKTVIKKGGFIPPVFFALFILSPLAAQKSEIILPQVTTYVPASVEQKIVLTSELLEAEHLESLAAVIERCGIQNLSYGPYGLDNKPSIRGFTDETVRVVIDGICVNNAQYGTFDFSSINMAAVEKIEIIRGGFTEGVEDEGAVGGVIYITTKKMQSKKSLEAESGLKTFFNINSPLDSVFQKINYSGKAGENNFLNIGATLNFAQNKYLFKCENEASRSLLEGPFAAYGKGVWMTRENSQVRDGQGNASFSHYYGDGNCLTIGSLFYAGHKNTPGTVTNTGVGLQKDYNNNLTVSLWNPALADGLFNFKNTLSWLCNNRFYKEDVYGNMTSGEESRHFINTFKYSSTADFYSLAGGRLKQNIGLSAAFTKLDSTNDGHHIQISGVVKETTKFAIGSFLNGNITASLPLAAKFCVNDNNANFAFVPKAGLAWDFSYIQFTADAYRMVQFPNMDDLFWEGGGYHGNPNLKPESGWGADLGFALHNCPVEASVTVFSNYYKDKIQWASGTTQNVASAFYLGLDFSFGASFCNGLFDFDLNGEYLYTRLLDKSNEYTYGKRIMWTPDFVCTAVFGANFEAAKLRLSAEYTGLRYTSNMNIYFLKPYLLVNFAAEGSAIGGKFVPFVKLDNILNWQYQSVEDYPMPGISMTIGGRYNFL